MLYFNFNVVCFFRFLNVECGPNTKATQFIIYGASFPYVLVIPTDRTEEEGI